MPSPYDRYRTHHRPRRLAGHDNAAAGWYFVRICTDGRRPLFGKVRGGAVGLSDVGCLAHTCWAAILDHAAGVRLDAFVVMPNHVHGLVRLAPPPPAPPATAAPPRVVGSTPASAMSERSPAAGSLSAVVRSYKAAVTRASRGVDPAFAWQRRFHDHVVRTAAAFHRIRAYIEGNPTTWDQDRLRLPK